MWPFSFAREKHLIKIEYTAARDISGIHDDGDTVDLEFSAAELTPGREVSRTVQKAIGGQRETLHHYGLRKWSVVTEPLALETLDAVLEFLASVEGGEEFTFEAWRQETGPSLDLDFVAGRMRVAEGVTCTLDSEGYDLQKFIGDGLSGGADDWYQVSFAVKELP